MKQDRITRVEKFYWVEKVYSMTPETAQYRCEEILWKLPVYNVNFIKQTPKQVAAAEYLQLKPVIKILINPWLKQMTPAKNGQTQDSNIISGLAGSRAARK